MRRSMATRGSSKGDDNGKGLKAVPAAPLPLSPLFLTFAFGVVVSSVLWWVLERFLVFETIAARLHLEAQHLDAIIALV